MQGLARKNASGRRPSWVRAFTLIEFLVTVTVLGILAGLLLPALAAAKSKARQVHCLSNIRQLSLASFIYASENEKHAGYDTTYSHAGWMGTLMPSELEKKLCLCPVAPLRLPTPRSGNAQGTADRAWVRWSEDNKIMVYSSYGYNGWLYSDLLLKNPSNNNPAFLFTRENTVDKPTQTPVFVDANWVDLWPLETDRPSPNLYEGWPTDRSQDTIGRCTIARHGPASPSRAPRNIPPQQKPPGAINMGLADGHAELVKLQNLWNYSWHRDWQHPSRMPWNE